MTERHAPPADDDLHAFVESLLGVAGASYLTEAEVVTETIEEHRDLWVMLYHVEAERPE